MRLWGRNGKFAFVGVILIVIGLASAFSVREVCRRLGLKGTRSVKQATVHDPMPSQNTTAPQVRDTVDPQVTVAAVSMPEQPRQEPEDETRELTIHVQGDANTITLLSSSFVNKTSQYQLDGDTGTSSFFVGPQQTALVELIGDVNTIHVATDLKDRVTVVNKGSGNQIVN